MVVVVLGLSALPIFMVITTTAVAAKLLYIYVYL
jgi:hypothetical protein